MPAISLVESNVCIVLIAWGTGAGRASPCIVVKWCHNVFHFCLFLERGRVEILFFMFAGQPDSDHVAFIAVVLNGNIFLCWNCMKGKPSYPCAFTPTLQLHPPTEREAFILHEFWTYCVWLLANCIRSRPNSVKLLFQILKKFCIFLPPVICVLLLHNSKLLCILQKTFRMSNAEH